MIAFTETSKNKLKQATLVPDLVNVHLATLRAADLVNVYLEVFRAANLVNVHLAALRAIDLNLGK